jgi:hypothetical protein
MSGRKQQHSQARSKEDLIAAGGVGIIGNRGVRRRHAHEEANGKPDDSKRRVNQSVLNWTPEDFGSAYPTNYAHPRQSGSDDE